MNMKDELHKLPGPLLLLAGPGTGKTYQLAKRIKYLVEEENVSPQNITVITFTNTAARNMHERISDVSNSRLYVPPEKQPKMICTMHSLGSRILGEKGSELGLSENIRVVSTDKLRNILVGDAAQLAGFKRDDGEETARCRQFGNCSPSDNRKCKICEEYQNILRKCSAVDHDDQILLACRVLKEDTALLQKYRSYCEHLLVDEYQDINAGQFELIYFLSKGQREGLFVVGDDDQSIYSWRGGSPKFIRRFGEHFGNEAQIKSLKKSFRCRRHILEGAKSVVRKYDKTRLSKGQIEHKEEEAGKIVIHNVASDQKEAYLVRSIVERVIASERILILLPYRAFSEGIVAELRRARIRYSAPPVLPGEGLPLISTLYQWLRDNSDSLAFRESLDAYINNPDSRIPSAKVKMPKKLEERENALLKISLLWKYFKIGKINSFWKAIESNKENDELYSKSFCAFERLRVLNEAQRDPASFIAEVVRIIVPWKKTKAFLDEIQLWVETSREIDGRAVGRVVQLVTLQGAKGLEADVVCIVGLEEGTLPKSGLSREDMAEQSRLMFVSMTRAIKELHLFHARKRSAAKVYRPIYKRGEQPDIEGSRFLDVIPDEHKEIKYHPA